MVLLRFAGYMPNKEKESSLLPDEFGWDLPPEESWKTVDGPDAAEAKACRKENELLAVPIPSWKGRKHLGASQRVVPSLVITVDGPRERSRSAVGLTNESRFKPACRDNSVSKSERQEAALLTDTPPFIEPSASEAAGNLPVFDPSRAYPSVPLARPFAGGAHQLTMRTSIREAHTWRFRIGIMICPLMGVTLALPVGLARLPSGLWIAIAGFILVGAVASLVLLHRAWTCINDGGARTSPRRAVGLLIVPIFNVYWVFHVAPGFATDFNLFIERHQIEARPLSRNLIFAAMVPLVGIVFCWGVIANICDSINCVRRSNYLEIDVKE
jgi:hypothetical protein